VDLFISGGRFHWSHDRLSTSGLRNRKLAFAIQPFWPVPFNAV
jgi:hypothetical protein